MGACWRDRVPVVHTVLLIDWNIFSINTCGSQSTPPQICAVRHREVSLKVGHSNWNSDEAIPYFNAAKSKSRGKDEGSLTKLHLSASLRVFQLCFTTFQFQKFTHACFCLVNVRVLHDVKIGQSHSPPSLIQPYFSATLPFY